MKELSSTPDSETCSVRDGGSSLEPLRTTNSSENLINQIYGSILNGSHPTEEEINLSRALPARDDHQMTCFELLIKILNKQFSKSNANCFQSDFSNKELNQELDRFFKDPSLLLKSLKRKDEDYLKKTIKQFLKNLVNEDRPNREFKETKIRDAYYNNYRPVILEIMKKHNRSLESYLKAQKLKFDSEILEELQTYSPEYDFELKDLLELGFVKAYFAFDT